MSQNALVALLLVSLGLLSCSSGEKAAESQVDRFSASGSDPDWSLEMNFENGQARLVIDSAEPYDETFDIPQPVRGGSDGRQQIYSLPVARLLVEIGITPESCEEERLADESHYGVVITLSDFRSRVVESRLEGCGRYDGRAELTRYWQLVSLDGEEVSATREDERLPGVQFLLAEGIVNGDGGCNYFTGDITIEGDSIRIGPIPSTKRACPRIGRESAFIGALREKAHKIEMANKRLILRSEYHVMVFRRE